MTFFFFFFNSQTKKKETHISLHFIKTTTKQKKIKRYVGAWRKGLDVVATLKPCMKGGVEVGGAWGQRTASWGHVAEQ